MPGPFDNSPVLPGTTLQPIDIRPYQAQTTQAIASLEDAFHKGLVDYNDLADAGIVKPRERRAKAAQLDLSARQSNAAMANNLPELQAQQGAAQINSGLQILPSQTSAAIAQNTAAGSQAGLQNIQIGGAVPNAQLEASEAQQDPTGELSQGRKLFQSLTGGAIPVPKAADGTYDYPAMQRAIYHAYFPNAPAPNAHATDDTYGEIISPFVRAQMWNTPQGKSVMEMAATKNRQDLLYGKGGVMLTPYEAGPLIANATASPKLSADDITAAASKIPQSEASLGMLDEATQLVNKPGIVGPQISGGANVINQKWTDAKAAMGNPEAVQKTTDRTRLEQTLATGILDQIRSLAGSGAGRVMGSEFAKMGQTVPALSDSPSVWNKWLSDRKSLINQAIAINQQIAAGKLPGTPSPNDFLSNQVSHASAPAAGLPKVMTQADYDALKPGAKYVDSAGNVATKRGQ